MPELHFLDTGVTFRYKGSFALGLKKKKKKGKEESNQTREGDLKPEPQHESPNQSLTTTHKTYCEGSGWLAAQEGL